MGVPRVVYRFPGAQSFTRFGVNRGENANEESVSRVQHQFINV